MWSGPHLQKCGHDETQVDVFSTAAGGAWLVLHSIINLVEHLRLDFMKDLKYEVLLSGTDRTIRAKKGEVEQARASPGYTLISNTFQPTNTW